MFRRYVHESHSISRDHWVNKKISVSLLLYCENERISMSETRFGQRDQGEYWRILKHDNPLRIIYGPSSTMLYSTYSMLLCIRPPIPRSQRN
uniref:Uncharacterized protein n=1 Tax=Trichogramma kaykai TaxID=54128 RepID=A0ABD2X060_9HYME